MAHAEHTVTVSRPAEEVFDFVADGACNPHGGRASAMSSAPRAAAASARSVARA